jgi:glycosyltransferase involved in cell wall biosynthesis
MLTVSVVIPTHGRPARLKNAIESVENQTRLPEELVVINDGTEELYPTKDRFEPADEIDFQYITVEESVGASAARNIGAEASTGNILMFLDDDDRWYPRKVERQIEIFERTKPTPGLVYTGRVIVDENNKKLYDISPSHRGNIHGELIERNVIGITSSVAIRRDIFERAGRFDAMLPARQDYDLWLRVSQITTVDFDPEPTVEWSAHSDEGDQMSAQPELYERAVKQLLQKYHDELRALPLSKRRKAYASQYATIAEKYSHTNSYKKYKYVLRSLLYYPTPSAIVKLLPRSLDLRLRQLVR